MSGIQLHDSPVIRNGFRLQYEAAQGMHVLLYPEGMVQLNTSATEILRLCDGTRTIEQIVRELENAFQASGLTPEVMHFVDFAASRGWLHVSR